MNYTVTVDTKEEFTLDALVEAVGSWIDDARIDHDNQQVTTRPDARVLRFYTTLGLLDRPHRFQDRRAIYGRRHLYQAVTIKRLQAAGLSLKDIQAGAFTSLATDRLCAMADGDMAPAVEESPPAGRGWSWRPLTTSTREPFGAPSSLADETAAGAAGLLNGIPLGAGVVLLVPSRRPIVDEELADLRRLSVPLLEQLEACGILDGDQGSNGGSEASA